eukprot:m.168474 g.168474  ORF g.168474 m.168474 type:complete len:686 (+) comp17217_c0_seq2:2587-4644(+)
MAGRRKRICLSYIIKEANVFERHRSGVNTLAFSETEDMLFSGGRDGIVRAWDITAPQDEPRLLRAFEEHVDWVNDVVVSHRHNVLLSGSSDGAIKIWDLALQSPSASAGSLHKHEDYVRALAYSHRADVLVSGGLDQKIVEWDISNLRERRTVTPIVLPEHKESVYALAINEAGDLVAVGSSDKVIRLWDLRSKGPCRVLKGHVDNVRCVALRGDSLRCLSGSSDGTLRMWDIGQQRCVATYSMHTDSVWSLHVNAAFDTAYTGGRDRNLFMTDLRASPDSEPHVLLATEDAPILKVVVSADESNVWVAKQTSSISNWAFSKASAMQAIAETAAAVGADDDSSQDLKPLLSAPTRTIQGEASIVKAQSLNDRIHVLTKDSNGNVDLWNILSCRKVESYGQVDFGEKFTARNVEVSVPQWCTLETKLGSLCVVLQESNCFAAWAYASVVGGSPNNKTNIGGLVVQALLRPFQERHMFTQPVEEPNGARDENAMEEDRVADMHAIAVRDGLSHNYFAFAPDLPVLVWDRTVFQSRYRLEGCGRHRAFDELMALFGKTSWVMGCLLDRALPFGETYKLPQRIVFNLLPDPNTPADQRMQSIESSHLQCQTILPLTKIAEHICQCLHITTKEDPESKVREMSEQIEVLCNGKVLPSTMDLATAKTYFWKSSEEMTLHYRRRVRTTQISV